MPTKTKVREKKQRLDLSREDISRLDHILGENALEDRSSACKFAIHKMVSRFDKPNGKLIIIDDDDTAKTFPWGFVCKKSVRRKIKEIMRHFNLKHLCSAIRLAIRFQAEEDGWEK